MIPAIRPLQDLRCTPVGRNSILSSEHISHAAELLSNIQTVSNLRIVKHMVIQEGTVDVQLPEINDVSARWGHLPVLQSRVAPIKVSDNLGIELVTALFAIKFVNL